MDRYDHRPHHPARAAGRMMGATSKWSALSAPVDCRLEQGTDMVATQEAILPTGSQSRPEFPGKLLTRRLGE